MLVYHGTTLEIKEPKIITTEIGRDFGFAFYTTDIKEQAERWALRRAKIQSRKSQNSVSAVVNIFDCFYGVARYGCQLPKRLVV